MQHWPGRMVRWTLAVSAGVAWCYMETASVRILATRHLPAQRSCKTIRAATDAARKSSIVAGRDRRMPVRARRQMVNPPSTTATATNRATSARAVRPWCCRRRQAHRFSPRANASLAIRRCRCRHAPIRRAAAGREADRPVTKPMKAAWAGSRIGSRHAALSSRILAQLQRVRRRAGLQGSARFGRQWKLRLSQGRQLGHAAGGATGDRLSIGRDHRTQRPGRRLWRRQSSPRPILCHDRVVSPATRQSRISRRVSPSTICTTSFMSA